MIMHALLILAAWEGGMCNVCSIDSLSKLADSGRSRYTVRYGEAENSAEQPLKRDCAFLYNLIRMCTQFVHTYDYIQVGVIIHIGTVCIQLCERELILNIHRSGRKSDVARKLYRVFNDLI